MERVLIDSWAWIEYFLGSSSGRQVHEAIVSKDFEIFTSVINQFEVFVKLVKLKDTKYAREALDFMQTSSSVEQLSREVVERAGHFKISEGLAMADSIVAATAEKHKATILTGDPDFKNLKGVKVEFL